VLSLSLPVAALATTLVSLGVAQALVMSAHRHGHLTMDLPGAVQKFHQSPTPRVGGIGIYIALAIAWVCAGAGERKLLTTLLVAGLPALCIGLLEDVTKRVSVRTRLLVTMAGGGLAAVLTGTMITRVDVPGVDTLLALWPVAILFTAFCVGGVSNAFNIIDGFHGLSSGTLILSSLALAAIASSVGDASLAFTAVMLAAAVAGFWLVNFPWGKLFLGDGGAYFSGFALAWLTVELVARNPQVSAWCSVLLCGYPTIEVLYSIYRRGRSRRSPGEPDRAHLHSLVATQVVHPRLAGWRPDFRNAAVSVLMWIAAVVTIAPAVLYPTRPDVLVAATLACAAVYHLVYLWVARARVAPAAPVLQRSLAEVAEAEEPTAISGRP
jgi:UDP-N-acetylmuramyl pentapeptide phosphotransferase/UDP-N-acetylglucosamine-1-phosphate transferase